MARVGSPNSKMSYPPHAKACAGSSKPKTAHHDAYLRSRPCPLPHTSTCPTCPTLENASEQQIFGKSTDNLHDAAKSKGRRHRNDRAVARPSQRWHGRHLLPHQRSGAQGAYERVIANGGKVAGPAAEALLNNQIGQDTLDWLKSNYFKTELELGHCLRLPAEGPCECDLYLRCSKFFTTSEYAPRLRKRLARQRELIQDATERNWPREIERHEAISRRIRELLNDLGEPCEALDRQSE
jgi:hypothetical protein